MSAHTPGPWKARSYTTDEGHVWVDCDSWVNPKTASLRGGTVATVLATGVGSGSVEANAQLIAAAPTMLAALRRIIEEDAEGRGYLADIASKALKEAGLEP